MLDPQARQLIERFVADGTLPTHTLTPAQAREAYLQGRHASQHDPQPMHGVETRNCPGPAGDIPLRLYRPVAETGASPALVLYHGGGWVIGDLETHDVLCRDLAFQSGCVVISVDYRLAPEHPFPAAVEDAVTAYRWVSAQATRLGLDHERIAVGGDSAGGNLAAVVALAVRDALRAGENVTLPAFQLLIYPVTDARAVAPSHLTNGQGYLFTSDTVAWMKRHYVPDATQWSDWRVSPALHPDFSGLPPALVLTAGFDPLRDEGMQYADALSQAGVSCQYVCFERQIHGFVQMGRLLTEADTAVALCAGQLRRHLYGMSRG